MVKKTQKQQKQKQEIKKIVKDVLKKTPEVKSYLSDLINASPVNNNFTIRNLFSYMTQGTTGITFVGRKIYVKNITFRGVLYTNAGQNTEEDTLVRIVIFKSKDTITTTSINSTNGSEFCRDDLSSNRILQRFDYNKTLNKYMDRTFTLHKDISGSQDIFKPFNFTIPVNRYHKFTGDSTGLFEDGQYYIAVTNYNSTGTANNFGAFSYTYNINFTDS